MLADMQNLQVDACILGDMLWTKALINSKTLEVTSGPILLSETENLDA